MSGDGNRRAHTGIAAAKPKHYAGRIPAAVILALLGITLTATGVIQLRTLSQAYRPVDILLTETPLTFQVWLGGLAQQSPASSVEETQSRIAEGVADRLGVMSLPLRRRIIINMARPEFWSYITPAKSTPRALKQGALNGVILALRSEPGAGDLYFAAAWLDMSLNGFGGRSRRMLEASQLFSPRELEIVVERLIMAPLIWSFLSDEEKSRLQRDLDYVRQAHPGQAEKITTELESQGVRFE